MHAPGVALAVGYCKNAWCFEWEKTSRYNWVPLKTKKNSYARFKSNWQIPLLVCVCEDIVGGIRLNPHRKRGGILCVHFSTAAFFYFFAWGNGPHYSTMSQFHWVDVMKVCIKYEVVYCLLSETPVRSINTHTKRDINCNCNTHTLWVEFSRMHIGCNAKS